MLIDQVLGLKEAVLNLPVKEKDKMLLKLISKDTLLLNRLAHQLLENDQDLEHRVKTIKAFIDSQMKYANTHIKAYDYYTPGYFMMNLRDCSGAINEHLSVTKHIESEVELRLYVLRKLIDSEGRQYFAKLDRSNEKLLTYVAGRIKHAIERYCKLHEDIQFDFSETLNDILTFAHGNALKNFIVDMGLPNRI